MINFSPGDRIELDYIGRGEDRKEISLREMIARGNNQMCFRQVGTVGDNVIKIIDSNSNLWMSSKMNLIEAGVENFSEFHFKVLESIERAGVELPSYWNAFNGVCKRQKVYGFIQTNLGPDCSFANGGNLPNIGQVDTGFLNDTHSRNDGWNEFYGSCFFDWDKYLADIISGKGDNESLEDFYQRIAETKMD